MEDCDHSQCRGDQEFLFAFKFVKKSLQDQLHVESVINLEEKPAQLKTNIKADNKKVLKIVQQILKEEDKKKFIKDIKDQLQNHDAQETQIEEPKVPIQEELKAPGNGPEILPKSKKELVSEQLNTLENQSLLEQSIPEEILEQILENQEHNSGEK